MNESPPNRERLLKIFNGDRVLAHQTLFRHRHPNETPGFHDDLIELWHSPLPQFSRVLAMAFREAGKSTVAEEAIVLLAAFQNFRNCVILGENQLRAIDRLTAIKHEFSTNDMLIWLFGPLRDDSKWNEGKVILSNGVMIQALGRGQEVRGMKHLDIRPDFCFADDVESKEHVRDETARKETLRWFFAEVLPALDKSARVRVNATPLDTQSLPMQLKKLPGWVTKTYPIRCKGSSGDWQALWPARYSLPWIEQKEGELRRLGLHHDFMREYMCEPDDPSKKTFTEGMFKVEPRLHVWQPVFAFYDPARTSKDTGSTTGWAAWSWVGNRLIVWDAGGERWLPDQLMDHMFKINELYHPVQVGVEKDGLEEFLMQPLRREMTKRSTLLPVAAMKAPQGKLDFIGGLQPFFASGEVSFAKPLPDLVAQFLNFPTGQIDGPNALAYALRMRPGLVVYEDFNSQHVVEVCLRINRVPAWLCWNATRGCTTAVLVQFVDGRLNIWKDWVKEGDPGQCVSDIAKEARLETGVDVRHVAPHHHFGSYDTIGLRATIGKLPAELRQGGDTIMGREEIRSLLKQTVRAMPAVCVAHDAHWTLNAFSCGYAREVAANGTVKDEPREGLYRTLMEGLESFAGLMRFAEEDAAKSNYAYTSTGQRYKTILPRNSEPVDDKAQWIGRVSDPRASLRQRSSGSS